MSYSMSPPAAYPPFQGAGSPGAPSPYAQPPAKRQRLSPDARSPNGTPNYVSSPHGMQHSGAGYGNVYATPGGHSPYSPGNFAGSPQSSFNTPQPYQQQQHMQWPVQQPTQQRQSQISPPPNSNREMPPPPRPNKDDREERANIEDLGDSLFMSGINLKDEENYLNSTWNNNHITSFATNNSTSFGSSTIASNSFSMLTQGTSFGSQGSENAVAGTMGPVLSQETIEEQVRRKREHAARRKAETEQFHLNNQFVQGNCLRNRMHKLATENAVRLDVQGVYLRNPESSSTTEVLVNGVGTEGIAKIEAKPESMIEAGVPYEHILSLVSLATQERLRDLLGDAYALARARQYGDHGRVVPPEFSDIAMGEGEQGHEAVLSESITGTQWDKLHDTKTKDANGEAPTNGETETPPPMQTITFQGTLNGRLREMADHDRRAEKEREQKRAARKAKADSEGGGDSTPAATPADTSAPNGTPAAPAIPKMTKKEEKKRKREDMSAAGQVLDTNRALGMAIGGKKMKYSWMTGASSAAPTNRWGKTPAGGSGTTTPKAQAAPALASTAMVKEPTWGDWREDSVDGRGIQVRDWVVVLEKDGHQRRELQKAMGMLQAPDEVK